jgi:CRP-like cAMP-binding protein
LAEGLVLLDCERPNGSVSVLGVRFPGQVIEHCAYAMNLRYPVSARALVPSLVYRISLAELHDRNRECHNPEISSLFERLLHVDLYNAEVLIMELKTSSAAERLFRLLLQLATATTQARSADPCMSVSVPLNESEIADLIGMNRFAFSRLKRALIRNGDLRQNGNVFSFRRNLAAADILA